MHFLFWRFARSGGKLQYSADQTKHYREAVVMDNNKKPFMFTIWDDLADNEGAALLRNLPDHPVILAKRIVVTIAVLQSFPVEGRISLPNYPQSFYLFACSNCNHFVRSKVRREVQCLNCDLPRMLVPRCHFELDTTDNTGTLTAIIAETLAEKTSSMIAVQVYETVAAQNQSLLVAHINRQFDNKLFGLQLLKPLFRFPDQKKGTLAISSYAEKQPPTFTLPGEGTKKAKLEPPTPTKRQ